MYNIFLAEIKRYFWEIKTYYPDFIVSIAISFILYLVLFSNNLNVGYGYVGYIYWILASAVLSEASISISSEKQGGTLKNLLIKPYSILTIMTFKTLAWFILNLSKVIILLILIRPFTSFNFNFSLSIFFVLLVTMISIYGFSLILMALTIVYTKTASFESIISYVLLFLSGTVIAVNKLPQIVGQMISYFPLTLGIKMSIEILENKGLNLKNTILLIILSLFYVIVGYIFFNLIIKKNEEFSTKY